MDKRPFFSIIVPVYNAEKYLDRCINSVLSQDCNDFEIILVDDGSTDNSMSICDSYKLLNERIVVIHQENSGQSKARNVGISVATGDYIIFLDSDDYLTSNVLEKTKKHLSGLSMCEMLQIKTTVVYENSKKKKDYYPLIKIDGYMDGVSFLKSSFNLFYCSTVWSFIYRRSFIEKHHLSFVEGIYHEDEEFIPRVLLKARFVSSCDINFYNYYVRQGSTMTKKNQTKNAESLLYIVNKLSIEFESIEDQELKRLLYNRLVCFLLTAVILGKYYHSSEKGLIDMEFAKKHAYSPIVKIKVLLLSINARLFYVLERAYLLISGDTV